MSPILNQYNRSRHNCNPQQFMLASVCRIESHRLSMFLPHPYYHHCLRRNLRHCQSSSQCSRCPTEKQRKRSNMKSACCISFHFTNVAIKKTSGFLLLSNLLNVLFFIFFLFNFFFILIPFFLFSLII